ncbi:MAG: cadmium-translocating P-type ATPase, partial [Desulfobacterales bacterium]|nr:cadmium-translocating P-type ATPase [Desulfobacterales bacterium]
FRCSYRLIDKIFEYQTKRIMMIGRHGRLNVYKKIFSSEDFIKTAAGGALIPIAFLVKSVQIQSMPSVSLMDMVLILSVIINGVPIIIGAVKGMAEKRLNVDELVSIAIIACLINGNFLEAAIVSAIMVTGALIEEAVSDSARHAIEDLIQTTPDTAILEKNGKEREVKVSRIVKGDIIVVKPGGIIPVDGAVMEGISAVDESAVTGEPIPKQKQTGDDVWAGTVSTDGFMRIRAEKVGRDSTMGKIISMVTAAEQSKIESAKIVDRYAAWFTPIILVSAALTYLFTQNFERAVTVLIVGCPCSFLLAGPVATVSAIGQAAKNGILVKGGIYLENIAKASGIFFDKTGTLTQGSPEVKEVVPLSDADENLLIQTAAALEKKMNHPLARAVVKKAEALSLVLPEAKDVMNIPGRGIKGTVDGQQVEVTTTRKFSGKGYTTVEVKIDQETKGFISMLDQARAVAAETINDLKSLGIKDIAVVSGDQEAPVKNICSRIGIERSYAKQTPGDKLDRISEYNQGKLVYVGDGINDAPALKASDTGIAMGLNGSDAALETADIVLMNDRLDRMGYLFCLSRTMVRVIHINIALSFLINLFSVFAGFMGWLTPILGAFTHNIGSILVVGLSASIGFFVRKGLFISRSESGSRGF